jgi:hypothetical protein
VEEEEEEVVVVVVAVTHMSHMQTVAVIHICTTTLHGGSTGHTRARVSPQLTAGDGADVGAGRKGACALPPLPSSLPPRGLPLASLVLSPSVVALARDGEENPGDPRRDGTDNKEDHRPRVHNALGHLVRGYG